jgi:hypothetical protein
MKIDVAIADLKGVRVVIAFPPPAWVAPGVGDVLLEQLRPHFPTLPIMLASIQMHGVRAHAAFQAQALIAGADVGKLPRQQVDLDLPPRQPDMAPPF